MRGDFTQCPDGGQIVASTPPGAAAPSLGQQPHNFTRSETCPDHMNTWRERTLKGRSTRLLTSVDAAKGHPILN